jgi:hypothetical protein
LSSCRSTCETCTANDSCILVTDCTAATQP